MTRKYLRGFGAALGLALLAFPENAGAHGGFPRAFEIIVEPGNPNDVVLRSDLWGFFRTTDGGSTWQWACGEVYGSDSLSVSHSSILVQPGGRILIANAFKGLRVTDDFCTWKEIAQFQGDLVADVTSSNGRVFVLTSTYQDGGIAGLLWQSTDNGDHFNPVVGSPLPPTFGGSDLAFAPSNPRRVYVAGRTLDEPGATVERSNDGGATWTRVGPANGGIPVLAGGADAVSKIRIAGIHPTRPDVVFLWADLEEGFGADEPDEIWGTNDAGATWRRVYRGTGDLPGFAFSPDGTEFLIAGPREGVRRANIDDVFANGGPFTQVFGGQVWGLNWTAAGITAGADNFTPQGVPAFTYGSSTDDGKSFGELMSICDVKYDACGATSSLGTACNNVYNNPLGGFLQDFTRGPRCTEAPVSGTGGSNGAGGSPTGGRDGGAGSPLTNEAPRDLHIATGCDIGGGRSTLGSAWPVLAALSVLARGVRRRCRRA